MRPKHTTVIFQQRRNAGAFHAEPPTVNTGTVRALTPKSLYFVPLSFLVTINSPWYGRAEQNPALQHGSDKKRRFDNVGDAIKAANLEQDEKLKGEIIQTLPNLTINQGDDVQAIYDQMKISEKESKDRMGARGEAARLLETQDALSKALANARSPELHAKVADLLDKERRELPSFFAGAREASTNEEFLKEMPQTARFEALMTAAGEGKNISALPVLRKIAQRNDLSGMLAIRAISQIGDPQDLDSFIRKIKSDPKARPDLSGFGNALVDRMLAEINNPLLPKETKYRLAGYLTFANNHEAIPKLWPLLRDKDSTIARIAAEAIVRSSQYDQQVLVNLLKEHNCEVRGHVLSSIGNLPWNQSWIPILIQVLRTDTDDLCRMEAAHLLGAQKVQQARGALEQAVKDRSPLVSSTAEDALNRLSK